jgi:hypothetical protein
MNSNNEKSLTNLILFFLYQALTAIYASQTFKIKTIYQTLYIYSTNRILNFQLPIDLL